MRILLKYRYGPLVIAISLLCAVQFCTHTSEPDAQSIRYGHFKVASMVSIDFANLFRGAIYICGMEHWTKHPPKQFQSVKSNRYVFLSGDQDFNRGLTYEIYRKYQDAGLRNIKLMIIPNMRHRNPETRYFRKAIHYLDERESLR